MNTPTNLGTAADVGLPSGDLLGWAYARFEDSEDWRGLWPTRDLAIEHGLSHYDDDESFWVAQAGPSSTGHWDFEIVGRPEKVWPNGPGQGRAKNGESFHPKTT